MAHDGQVFSTTFGGAGGLSIAAISASSVSLGVAGLSRAEGSGTAANPATGCGPATATATGGALIVAPHVEQNLLVGVLSA